MIHDDSIATLEEQARRCRRLAASLVDPDMRQALEQLAEEYEERAGAREPFMLGKRSQSEDEDSRRH